ncbi:MAG: lipid A deacylase LpxR family protein [Pseudomonadota bacterium]
MRYMLTIALSLGLATAMTPAVAQTGDGDGTISIVFENDFFASDDFNYTNGTKFSYLSGPKEPKGLARYAARQVLGMHTGPKARHGFGFGQSLYTPEDILESDPLPGQHPYAAFLYGYYTTMVSEDDRMTQLTVQAGIVGPSAYGEDVQNFVHEIFGGDEAQGWDNQIGDEFGLSVTLDKRRRFAASWGNDLAVDVIPSYGATVGNIRTDAHAGITLRLGENLADDFGPARVIPGLGGTSNFSRKSGLSWHAFGGVEGRVVAHNIFVDGSLFKDEIVTADSRTLVGDAQGGLVLQYGRFQLSYIHVFRSGEFENSGGSDEFGALSFAMKVGG